ncbi:hypothetical protein AWB81_07802 [Caballeronia arationis]|uniref:Uncharacterized protein n=1 Tax=Caballeronia arationis TaxID=1777142 RepID=A0A7Z7I5B8_9BURK|nr:hypothetical protein AWB81_07802 [Caballeronia arationis]SOE64337.1 hypothetical protein SAMN05446927_2716 [Caballeronia arationis]
MPVQPILPKKPPIPAKSFSLHVHSVPRTMSILAILNRGQAISPLFAR